MEGGGLIMAEVRSQMVSTILLLHLRCQSAARAWNCSHRDPRFGTCPSAGADANRGPARLPEACLIY